MSSIDLVKALETEVSSEDLFPPDARIVVGVSGGADSMCLLHALVALNHRPGFDIVLHVAHLNHQIRGADAESDAGFVQAAADGYGLPCTVESANVAERADAQRVSIEEMARAERYRFFERVCRRSGARFVAVGHHADDNVETVLHRVLRGTGLRGLAGIPRSRPLRDGSGIRLVRPLLRRTRREILEYNQAQAVPFREDASNASDEPTRNRLRNTVLPMLAQQINPQVGDALLRLAEQARWVGEHVESTAETGLKTLIIEHTDQELSLNAAALARKSRFMQTELVRRGIALFGLGEQDVNFGHLCAVVDLVAGGATGKQLHLPGGMTVSKVYERLVFAVPSDQPRESSAADIVIHVPGRTFLPRHGVDIECEVAGLDPGESVAALNARHPGEEWLDFDAVLPPLIVRHRRPGDRFWPLGAPGSKKIGEFLIDTKVNPAERERLAVVCDRLGPVWLIGHRIDERVKLTRWTRQVLKLRAQRTG